MDASLSPSVCLRRIENQQDLARILIEEFGAVSLEEALRPPVDVLEVEVRYD